VSYILCSQCKVTLKCHKNERVVRMGGAEIMYGDEYICPVCGLKVVTGFGQPIMPWHPDYDVFVKEVEVEGKY
jgi:hypothetical protein